MKYAARKRLVITVCFPGSLSPLQQLFSQPQSSDAESDHGQVVPLDDVHDRVVDLV